MMHNLEAPDEFTGRSAQSDYGIRPFVVALANSAKIIRARASCRNENEIIFRIDRKSRPGIPSAGVWIGFVGPGNWIPGPAHFARACIKCAYNPASDIDFPVVRNGRADDHQIVCNGWRGRDLIPTAPLRSGGGIGGEIDGPAGAEIRARLSRFGVKCDQTCIEGSVKNAKRAKFHRLRSGIAPCGNTP